MKLGLLILIIGILIFLFCLYRHHFSEPFVPGRYVIAWQIPADKGGDPQCCGYDWQVCTLEDKQCASPVDSGSIAARGVPVAATSKVNWGDTYNIMVRAKNSAGTGPWTTAQLTAGGGVLSAITMAQAVAADGTVTTPLSSNSTQLMVWTSIAQNQSVNPNTMKATATVTQIRNGKIIDSSNNEAMTAAISGGQDTFTLTLTGLTIQVGDVFKAYIYVQTQDGSAFTDGQGSLSISVSAPGSVTGITWAYMPYGSPDSPPPALLGCDDAIQYLNAGLSMSQASAFATTFMAGTPFKGATFDQCNAYQKGQVIMSASATPPSDPSRTCSAAVVAANNLVGTNPNEACAAYNQFIGPVSSSGATWSEACTVTTGSGYQVANPILTAWGNQCPNKPPQQPSCPFIDPNTGKCLDWTMNTQVCAIQTAGIPSPNTAVLVTGANSNFAITNSSVCQGYTNQFSSSAYPIFPAALNDPAMNHTVVNVSLLQN
jgi:hypothetical protein